MSTCATWDVLQIARDARLSGLPAVEAELLAEIAPDFEYVRLTHTRRLLPFVLDDGDPYEEDYQADPPDVQRAAWRREALAMDWLSWRDPLKTSSFDAMLREMYPAASVSSFAMRPSPAFGMLRRERDPDAIEMRVRSYANIITPVLYGVIKVGP